MAFSDLLSWASDNPLDALEGSLTLYSAYQGNRDSSQATDDARALTAEDAARNQKIYELFAEGGNNLKATTDNLLSTYGSFGQVTPDTVLNNREYFADERSQEEAANRGEVDDLTLEDTLRLKGYESAFRDYADTQLDRAEGRVYGRDAQGQLDAPSAMDYSQIQDMLSKQFMDMRTDNTQRALDVQYSKALANIPEGLENSTLRVQMERSMADLASQKYNEDMMASIGDAQSYLSGLQQTASNQQNMTNAERNMQRSLLSDSLTYGTQTLANSQNSGKYGQGLATNIDAQTGMNIDEVNARNSMRNNTALSDYLTGISSVGAENKLANDYLSQVSQITTAPYQFTAAGQNAISNNGAMDSLSRLAATAGGISSGNMKAAGGWWDDLRKNYEF